MIYLILELRRRLLRMTIKGKEFDCVKFKDELFANSWEKSGAKNIDEYVAYVNKRYKLSPLYKNGN